MPDAGAYLNLKPRVHRAIPTQLAPHEPPTSVAPRVAGLLAPIALFVTLVMVAACAVLLWLAPWPVDALAAVGAAVAWASWIDGHET